MLYKRLRYLPAERHVRSQIADDARSLLQRRNKA
jgi:hypothetical protein